MTLETRVRTVADQVTVLLDCLDRGDVERAKTQARAVVSSLYAIQKTMAYVDPSSF